MFVLYDLVTYIVTDPMERIPGYHNVNSDYPHLQSWTSLCTMHNYKAMLLRFGPCRLWLNCWQVSPKVVKIWNQAMIEKESCDQSSISPPCPGQGMGVLWRRLPENIIFHSFYFLPVRVSNILKFWFVCSVYWVLSAVFLQPFFQNSLLFAKQMLFGLV